MNIHLLYVGYNCYFQFNGKLLYFLFLEIKCNLLSYMNYIHIVITESCCHCENEAQRKSVNQEDFTPFSQSQFSHSLSAY